MVQMNEDGELVLLMKGQKKSSELCESKETRYTSAVLYPTLVQFPSTLPFFRCYHAFTTIKSPDFDNRFSTS